MARDNRLWGAERIRGELLKLGLRVCKRTIQKYMRPARPARPRGQNWKTFLCHQIPKAARSSPSRSWVGSIMTIEEVHKFFQRRLNCKRPTQSASPVFITRHMLVICGAPWNTQGRWMLSGTGGSGCKNKDILPILTSCDFQGSHDQIIEEVTCIFLAGYHK
jgi:hypothetical protein